MHKILATAAACGLMAFGGPAMGDPAQHLPVCNGCHGADGASGMPDAPIIAGLMAAVLEDALYAYQDGARKCAPPGVMCQLVAGLSEEDVVGLAAHYAELPYKPAVQEFDADLAAKGEELHEENCAICHGIHEPGDPSFSIIHGQKLAYLRYALQQYAAGEREQDPAMQAAVTSLTADELEAIANYLASYKGSSD